MSDRRFLRRKDAAQYLQHKFGFGSVRTLAKAVCSGDGPEYRKAGRYAVYEPAALDTWALSKISEPLRQVSKLEAAE